RERTVNHSRPVFFASAAVFFSSPTRWDYELRGLSADRSSWWFRPNACTLVPPRSAGLCLGPNLRRLRANWTIAVQRGLCEETAAQLPQGCARQVIGPRLPRQICRALQPSQVARRGWWPKLAKMATAIPPARGKSPPGCRAPRPAVVRASVLWPV